MNFKIFFMGLLGLGLFASVADAAQPALHKMALLNIEMEGDLSDTSHQSEWPYRLESLARHLREGFAANETYEMVSLAPADEWFQSNKGRKSINDCKPCLTEIAKRVGADRIFAGKVIRMSNLVLFLQFAIVDATSGQIVMTKNLSFRGDNDQSWLRSAEFLIDEMKDIPPESR